MIRCRRVPSCLCPSGNGMTRRDLGRGTVLKMAEQSPAQVLEGFCIVTQDHSPWTANVGKKQTSVLLRKQYFEFFTSQAAYSTFLF